MLSLAKDDEGIDELLYPKSPAGSVVSTLLPANIYLIREVGHGNW